MDDGGTSCISHKCRKLVRLLLDNLLRDKPAAEQNRDANAVERIERFGELCALAKVLSAHRQATCGSKGARWNRTAMPQLVPRLGLDVAELDVDVFVEQGGGENGAEKVLGELGVRRGEDVGEGRALRAALQVIARSVQGRRGRMR